MSGPRVVSESLRSTRGSGLNIVVLFCLSLSLFTPLWALCIASMFCLPERITLEVFAELDRSLTKFTGPCAKATKMIADQPWHEDSLGKRFRGYVKAVEDLLGESMGNIREALTKGFKGRPELMELTSLCDEYLQGGQARLADGSVPDWLKARMKDLTRMRSDNPKMANKQNYVTSFQNPETASRYSQSFLVPSFMAVALELAPDSGFVKSWSTDCKSALDTLLASIRNRLSKTQKGEQCNKEEDMQHLHLLWVALLGRKCDPGIDGLALPPLFFILQAGCSVMDGSSTSTASLRKDTMRRVAFAGEAVAFAMVAHQHAKEVHDADKSKKSKYVWLPRRNKSKSRRVPRYANDSTTSESDCETPLQKDNSDDDPTADPTQSDLSAALAKETEGARNPEATTSLPGAESLLETLDVESRTTVMGKIRRLRNLIISYSLATPPKPKVFFKDEQGRDTVPGARTAVVSTRDHNAMLSLDIIGRSVVLLMEKMDNIFSAATGNFKLPEFLTQDRFRAGQFREVPRDAGHGVGIRTQNSNLQVCVTAVALVPVECAYQWSLIQNVLSR